MEDSSKMTYQEYLKRHENVIAKLRANRVRIEKLCEEIDTNVAKIKASFK